MKYDIKSIMLPICLLGVIFGRVLSRLLSKHFGVDGGNIVVAGASAIAICSILVAIVMGHYLEVLIMLIMSIPLIVGAIGMYLDNMYIVGAALVLMFIIYPVLIKVIPWLRNNK